MEGTKVGGIASRIAHPELSGIRVSSELLIWSSKGKTDRDGSARATWNEGRRMSTAGKAGKRREGKRRVGKRKAKERKEDLMRLKRVELIYVSPFSEDPHPAFPRAAC